MAQEKISGWQLISIIILFEIGTTVLFGLRMQAKQDEWLAILAAMLGGLALMWVYTKLCEYYPSRTLVQMIPEIVGKWLGYPLSLIYIVNFAYESSRVLRDFGELIAQTILTETPTLVVMAGFMLSIVYCLRGGLEVLGRLGEILFPVAFVAFVLGWILIFSSQIHHFEYTEPVLAKGLKPIWDAVFPFLIVFPFGQSLLFMMFATDLNDRSGIRKAGMIAILASGIILALNMLGLISVFGPLVLKETEFPLYTAIGMVNLGDFIMNLDALAILMMVLGGFFKLGAFMYGTVLGTAQLFKLKSYYPLLIPWGTIILALSFIIASTYSQHIYIGWNISIPYIFFPLYVVIPILLLIIAAIRKMVSK
ncbi:GerAB/ArcD/ProY family transporter [Paenibacillus rhizophilus]|uniref:Spore gernimation protein KB n=1 Tax=Paenibacillus rhizophilus TaxID=1850366 RepID=A0A3N9P1H9_9BACL|nr:endospore germination permease [Paenibacillus rhizophilus]RQW09150.1 spore gernimation protein KB [Paenibacillus rhizophilus]